MSWYDRLKNTNNTLYLRKKTMILDIWFEKNKGRKNIGYGLSKGKELQFHFVFVLVWLVWFKKKKRWYEINFLDWNQIVTLSRIVILYLNPETKHNHIRMWTIEGTNKCKVHMD